MTRRFVEARFDCVIDNTIRFDEVLEIDELGADENAARWVAGPRSAAFECAYHRHTDVQDFYCGQLRS